MFEDILYRLNTIVKYTLEEESLYVYNDIVDVLSSYSTADVYLVYKTLIKICSAMNGGLTKLETLKVKYYYMYTMMNEN